MQYKEKSLPGMDRITLANRITVRFAISSFGQMRRILGIEKMFNQITIERFYP